MQQGGRAPPCSAALLDWEQRRGLGRTRSAPEPGPGPGPGLVDRQQLQQYSRRASLLPVSLLDQEQVAASKPRPTSQRWGGQAGLVSKLDPTQLCNSTIPAQPPARDLQQLRSLQEAIPVVRAAAKFHSPLYHRQQSGAAVREPPDTAETIAKFAVFSIDEEDKVKGGDKTTTNRRKTRNPHHLY